MALIDPWWQKAGGRVCRSGDYAAGNKAESHSSAFFKLSSLITQLNVSRNFSAVYALSVGKGGWRQGIFWAGSGFRAASLME
jgi:predicted cobalt transporter CbtA